MIRPATTIFLAFAFSTMLLAGISSGTAKGGNEPQSECSLSFEECVAQKRLVFERQAAIGMKLVPVTIENEKFCLGVAEVNQGGAADKAGLKERDLILQWDGKEITPESRRDFFELHRNLAIDQKVEYLVQREEEKLEFTITAEKPTRDIVDGRVARFIYEQYGQEAYENFLRHLEENAENQ
ncbi:MAG: PDZ domain-containing protein [bacterium]|nr:PDZ domain-containing protein [bacterium]